MQDGEVEFNGASFAWGSRAWEGQPDVLPGDSDPDTPKADDSKSKKGHPAATTDTDIESQRKPGIESRSSDSKEVRAPTTLHSLEFKIAPGEFVGIAGEVCAGILALHVLHFQLYYRLTPPPTWGAMRSTPGWRGIGEADVTALHSMYYVCASW